MVAIIILELMSQVVIHTICPLFRVICQVYKKPREHPALYSINAQYDKSIDIGVDELWVLNEDEPSGLKDLSTAMGQERPQCGLPYRFFDLVLYSIRQLQGRNQWTS